jgi:F-type H+-transporting ATPase subunit c
MPNLPLFAEAATVVSSQWAYGLGLLGAALGAGLCALAAGIGISRIAAAGNESVARQPEAAGDIRGVTIITAAFIEGVCLFACVICLLVNLGMKDVVTAALGH